jgi:predicted Zn-dependent protease
MKFLKFFPFILLFSLLILFSCSSDDDSNSSEDNSKAENLKPLGVSASDLLSQNTYTSLTVELAYSSGYRPMQQTLDDFKTFLSSRINKPDGITFIETEITTPLVSTQSLEEIKELEAVQRTQYTVGDDIAVFVYFTHAKADTDTDISVTLGTAYLNTSMVVYEQTLRNISASQNTDLYLLEETTIQHEVGHLFGLVNIQNDDIHTDHEDLAHRKHCFVEDCLMYYESNLKSYFRSRTFVPQLDPLCIEDLQAKGGK